MGGVPDGDDAKGAPDAIVKLMMSPTTSIRECRGSPTNSGAAPRRGGRRLLVVIAANIVGGAGLTGAIVALILVLSADIREVTHRFLGHVRARRDAEAYAMLTARMRSAVPPSSISSDLDHALSNSRQSSSEWINGMTGGSLVHGGVARECDTD
jgi:hypothetical protein